MCELTVMSIKLYNVNNLIDRCTSQLIPYMAVLVSYVLQPSVVSEFQLKLVIHVILIIYTASSCVQSRKMCIQPVIIKK